MEIHIHIHHHSDSEVMNILKQIKQILKTMPTKEEWSQLATELREALSNIGADIQRLTDKITAGGLNDAEETAAFAELRTLGDAAKELAAKTPEEEVPPVV